MTLLYAKQTIVIPAEIQPVCLPTYTDASDDFVGQMVTLTGWGRPSDSKIYLSYNVYNGNDLSFFYKVIIFSLAAVTR